GARGRPSGAVRAVAARRREAERRARHVGQASAREPVVPLLVVRRVAAEGAGVEVGRELELRRAARVERIALVVRGAAEAEPLAEARAPPGLVELARHRVARAAADVRVEAAAEREAARLHAAAQAEPGAAAVGLLDVEGGVVAGGVPVHARVEAGPAGVAVVAAQVLGQRAAADRLGAAEREAGVA